jgi:A/G-specific adenine glycosylase
LQAAARQIISKWNNRFPREYHDLRILPGLGEYTAAAVSSIAFGHKHAAIDGNVLRVLARLLDEKGSVTGIAVQRKLAATARSLISSVGPRSAGTWNQALMELGAIVCTPQNPSCDLCPLKQWCSSLKAGTQCIRPVKTRPHKKEKVITSVIVCKKDGQFLMRQRPENFQIMPGFWELPEVEGRLLREADLVQWGIEQLRRVRAFSHGITSRIYDVNIYTAALKRKSPGSFCWVSQGKLSAMPLTTITRKTLVELESNPSEGR